MIQEQKTTEQVITRDSIFPSYFDTKQVKIKEMSLGYVKNALKKMNRAYIENPLGKTRKGYIDMRFKAILEEEYKIKFLSNAIIYTEDENTSI